MMTLQEKITIAEAEVKQAALILNIRRKDVVEWENLLELRTETLAALKEQAKPAKRKVKS